MESFGECCPQPDRPSARFLQYGFLSSRAHANKLATVGIREKILAKKRNQSERKEADNKEAGNEGEPNRNELRQQRRVGGADLLEQTLETPLETGKHVLR